MALSLLLCELTVFTEPGGEVRVGIFLVSIANSRVSITRVTRVAGVVLSTVIVFILVGILSGVVVCISLSLIVKAFILVGGWIISGHLRMALTITGVDGLGKGVEFGEGVGFADAGNFVLDLGWKSAIQMLAEGSVAPLDLGVVRQLKLTRYFTMCWLSCMWRFLRSALASPLGSCHLKLFFNSPTKSE